MKILPIEKQNEYGKNTSVFAIKADKSLEFTTILNNGTSSLKVWEIDINDFCIGNVSLNTMDIDDYITHKEIINTDWESFI